MNDIQIDMYPVGLGSAMLIQFTDEHGHRIRVLADGGVGHGKTKDTVRDDLLSDLSRDDDGNGIRIDLIVGTHYDADHLTGLVPIILDDRFEIGEVWLPPVVDDTENSVADNGRIQDTDTLAHLFYSDTKDQARLRRYMNRKMEICCELTHCVDDNVLENFEGNQLTSELNSSLRALQEMFANENRILNAASIERCFKQVEICAARYQHFGISAENVASAKKLAGEYEEAGSEDELPLGHGDETWQYPPDDWDGDESDYPDGRYVLAILKSGPFNGIKSIKGLRLALKRFWGAGYRTKMRSDMASLLAFVKGQARDAINAKALSDVVGAIRTRNGNSREQIDIHCHVIPEGMPSRFIWQRSSRRFRSSSGRGDSGPTLTVIAPSDRLVRKHLNRLPVGTYALKTALYAYDLKRVTPSNQLSYVIKAEFRNQGILISGDTGLVDFVTKVQPPRKYNWSMLDLLMPLHVVQVAHHGGNNWYFYEVLMEAGYDQQSTPSYLLLSHAIEDRYRPSKVFGDFMRDLKGKPCQARVLFTSRPKSDYVKRFKKMIEPPTDEATDEGGIRVSFDGKKWTVDRHAVKA